MYSINYGKVATSTAICFYHNKRLDCTADSSVKGNKYCISLKTEKTLGTASSIKKWNKVDLEAKIRFSDDGKIEYTTYQKTFFNYRKTRRYN